MSNSQFSRSFVGRRGTFIARTYEVTYRKDAIVRRTEYFNVLEQLREVEDEITKLQRKLGSASVIDRKLISLLCIGFSILNVLIFF